MLEKQKGLTLVELLVVTSIIMILSAVTIPNWNKGGERLKVTRATYQVHQSIRRAQELTLASARCEQCDDCNYPHGYGIHFENGSSSYDLFGECNEFIENPDGSLELEEGYLPVNEKKVRTHLEEGVEIKRIKGKTETTKQSIESLTINYRPPNPTVLIRDENGNSLQEGIIRLKSKGFCQKIRTNKVGLVEISDISECP